MRELRLINLGETYGAHNVEDSRVRSGNKPVERPWTLRYAGALAFTAVAFNLWLLFPSLHDRLFIFFIAAVILSARFCGFGPALFSTLLSAAAVDYFVFLPHRNSGFGWNDALQLLAFVMISILVGSIARQKTQAELRAEDTRRRLASIVEHSEDAIFSTTAEGLITSWNRGAEHLYGYPAEEVMGKHISIIAPPERADEIPRNMERLNRGERVASYQTERLRKDGTRVSVLLSISPLRNRQGTIVGASAIAHDMTAQRKSEDALRRNERLAMTGRLAATVAHEINNPLEAITNLLYLARHDPLKADEYLRLAESEVDRVASIARQTLGFVRDSVSTQHLSVTGMLDEALGLHARRLDAKKIATRKEYREPMDIRGYPGDLRQLFSNLIANAIDALPEGGRLRLRAVPCRAWDPARTFGVRVTVADNGSGVRPEDRSHLFEPFFTTKKDAGTGVGLWLSHSIVQKHQGAIRVRSHCGVPSGTVFRIFLPREPAPSAADASHASALATSS